ncbi:hypothetical protein TL16_g12830 [Triparma laevis f. inornata]|uniref:Uncharacterized protein n=1 Tax=Triparma laevis f. inornata TaxID=1714386 RepID=A0A9W7BWU5_9STRA|nr:hypothetical protein TL16_g12830 [Triparma laevis f. inornata]
MLKPSSLSHLCLRRSFLRLSSTLASNVEVKGKGNEKGEGRRKSRYAPSSAAVLNGRIMEGETFQATITFALASSPSMNYVNWATTFSTLGKFKNKKTNTDEFKKLIKEFEGKLDGGLKWIPIREVASVAQSFRYLGVDSYKFREFINSNAEEITTSGNPRSLADITLIYKEAGGEYFEEMERKEVVKLMCEGRVSNVAKYVAGVAKIGSKVPVLARVMDEEKVVEKFVRAHPQDLSTTVFGMARLGHEVPKFLEALGQKDVVDRIAGAYPEDISNTIWSFAAYGYKSPHLIEAITQREEVTQKIIGGREVDISRTIFALQKLEVEVPASLKEALRLKKAKRKNTKLMKEGAVDLPFKRGVSPVVIEQNLKLRELQKSKDWSGMLRYAAKRFEGFDHVNWTTLFSELGKFRWVRYDFVLH